MSSKFTCQSEIPLCAILFGLLALIVTIPAVKGEPFTRTEPAAPSIAKASDEASDAMAVMSVPDGWHVQLFAAEPDIANVVAMAVDDRGRVYVCETFRQDRGVTDNRAHDETWLLADLSSETVQDRVDYHKRLLGQAAVTYEQQDDRIRRLVDRDHDGSVDESTIFAKGFNGIAEGTGAGVLPIGTDVYYTCIPKLWKLTDSDDDGVSEDRVALSDGYGVRVAFRGHDLHGLVRGPDGRLYFTIGDRGYHITKEDGSVLADPTSGAVFRCELDGSGLEVIASGLRNPQELAFNDIGDFFSVDNNSDSGDKARIVQILPGGDSGWRMHYQYLPDRGPFNRQRLWEPLHDEQPAHIVPPIANLTDGPSGLAYYPGTGFGDALKNQFLICDFRGGASNSGIRSFNLVAEGAFYELAATDRPIWTVLATDLAFGPDGALYVSDWVNGWVGEGKARIYRLTDPTHASSKQVTEVSEYLAAGFEHLDDEVLVQRINHVDRRIRLRSQWELAERGAADALIAVAENTSSDVIPRLHGVWGAQHAARIEPSLRLAVVSAGRRLLADHEPTIRAAACQLAAEQNDAKAIQRLTELVSDNHPRVVMHAMLALARLGSNQAARSGLDPVLAVLAKSKNQDPAIRHAAIQYLTRAIPGEFLADLSANNNVHVRRAAVAALRLLADGHVAAFLNDANPIVASEAAIAIHDRPIPVAIEDLASQLSTVDPATSTEAFLRRAISANFKIGTGAAADRLTDFAASSASPEWARIEALDCLLDWTDPDPRDRVTNEFRPTPSRQNGLVEKSLDNRIEELMLASASVREKSIDVASQLGLARIAPQLQSRVSDSKLRPDNRAGSLIALARLDSELAVELAKGVSAKSPVTLAVAALDILGQHAGEESLARFVDATKSDVAIVRGRGWDLLATSESATATDRIREGVADYLAGSLSADVHLNVIEAARLRLTTAEIDELNAALEHASLQDPMVRWMPSLHGGNVQRGADLFFGKTELSCVRCHKVDRVGGEVGPNLTLIGKQRDRQSLLESICLPDAKIAEGYETAVIANEDGQVFTGIVGMEDDDIIELIAADGARVQIDQEEIIARKKGKSSMPAGLAKLMTPRELRDLVAYLASLQVSRRNADETE